MAPFLPRLRRRLDRVRWVSIREASRSGPTYSPATMSARVEGPPNFSDPNAAEEEDLATSQPPTYSQVRSVARPEIARLIPNRDQTITTARPEAIPSIELNAGDAGLTSSNMIDLNDIRHEEVGSHLHMEGRISVVAHDPVYVNPSSGSPTSNPSSTSGSRQPRKPVSSTSTSTTTVHVAVAQLPGAEPFDIPPLPTADLQQAASSKTSTPLSRSRSSPSTSISASAAVSGPMALQPDPMITTAGNFHEISWFWDDLCQEYWKPPDLGYYGPQSRPTFTHTRSWPTSTNPVVNERTT